MAGLSLRYESKVAVVTGGGSGIGEACCAHLAREGARVAVIDRDGPAAINVAEQIRAQGEHAIALTADVSEPNAIREALAQVKDIFGRLDLAVNSAGIGGSNVPLAELPASSWDRTLSVNLTGVFHSMQAEYPLLKASGGGAIVNLSSILGLVAIAEEGAYVAAKHGVIGLSKCAAASWGGDNIRVSAVCPTFVNTPMGSALSDNDWSSLASLHALGRLDVTP